jgi:integrase/recombinase XerD
MSIDSLPVPATCAQAIERFLATSSFARRTRQSYAEDLAPLLRRIGRAPIRALTREEAQRFLARQEGLAPATYNRRLAALRSLVRWLGEHGWLDHDPLDGIRRHPQGERISRALDPRAVESVLRSISAVRDRALFRLIYDGGLRCKEALAIDIEEINWTERAIVIHNKGGRRREMFFSRSVSTLLETYLITRGRPTAGPLFVTHRRARAPRRADLTPDGYARLSYRQADTRWKRYAPGWNLHQLRHTAISLRAANEYSEVDLKRFSGHRSLRSLERYIAENREATKRKAREWERQHEPLA